MIDELINHKVKIKVYDPEAMSNFKEIYDFHADIEFCESPNEAIANSDALVLMTEWKEFRSINPEILRKSMPKPVIFDGRNIYDSDKMEQNGIAYYGIGTGRSSFFDS